VLRNPSSFFSTPLRTPASAARDESILKRLAVPALLSLILAGTAGLTPAPRGAREAAQPAAPEEAAAPPGQEEAPASPTTPAGPGATSRAREIASYRIEVELDPESSVLHGSETLHWNNPSRVPVDELWFHMYQNAFRNEASSRMIEEGGFPPGEAPLEERIGYIELNALQLGDGTDLLDEIRWRHPDDDVTTDRTLFSVPLPEAVPPGGSVEVQAGFTTAGCALVDRQRVESDGG